MGQVGNMAERLSAIPSARAAIERLAGWRANRFDAFVILNLTLFMTIRWIQDAEFAFYMIVMAVLLVGLWSWLRRFEFPLSLFVATEVGLIAHFAGGLVVYGAEGVRLYGHYFLGIRFDKVVHTYSCIVLVFVAWQMLRQAGIGLEAGRLWLLPVLVLGVGAFWEIIEYSAVATMAHTGVGDYVNNAQDLVANLFGALAGTALIALRQTIRQSHSRVGVWRTLREGTRTRR